MNCNLWKCFGLLFCLLSGWQCGSLERDNPLDPASSQAPPEAILSLYLPLPKPLVSVVHRVIARLEGPDFEPIVEELSLSPLGPATGTFGALQPGSDRTLILEGYNLRGELIFEGRREGITIIAGDTVRVEVQLRLIRSSAPAPAESDSAWEVGEKEG